MNEVVKQNAVPALMAFVTLASAFTMVQVKSGDNTRRIDNLEKYTRVTQREVEANARALAVHDSLLKTVEKQRAESDEVLRGVEKALNKTTVAVELLSAKIAVNVKSD